MDNDERVERTARELRCIDLEYVDRTFSEDDWGAVPARLRNDYVRLARRILTAADQEEDGSAGVDELLRMIEGSGNRPALALAKSISCVSGPESQKNATLRLILAELQDGATQIAIEVDPRCR